MKTKKFVNVACRRGAVKRVSSSVACPRGAGRSMSTSVACPRGTSKRKSTCVACRRVVGKSTKSCTAGTDPRVSALWMPRDRGKLQDQLVEVPQRTFEQLQVVDVLAVGEEKLVPQQRVQQRFDCMEEVLCDILQERILSGWADRDHFATIQIQN